MAFFPAVMIGGPPDTGKSVLAACLTQALRERGVQHYVLRACPDGEGDWTYLADQDLVRTILVPRQWTPSFVEHVCRDLQRRHLPLIVDVGGRPQPWQEAIFDQCTHAILLTPDDAARAKWAELAARHGLQVLADLTSDLNGETCLIQEAPIPVGTLAGLDWSRIPAAGRAWPRSALFEALVDRLARLFHYDARALRRSHQDAAPAEIVVDLDRLARTLSVPHRGEQPIWKPAHLPAVLDYLPEGVLLGIYGRGPNWLYAALALLAHPACLYQFDPRLGWVPPVSLGLGRPRQDAPLQAAVHPERDHARIELSLPVSYIDYLEADGLCVPPTSQEQGTVLSGKLPHWLWTGLALAYRDARWLAVYQPQLQGAVIVHARAGTPPVGSVL
jgi:CRISPR-associated protein Csx3